MKIGDSGEQRSHLHMRRFHPAHSARKARNHADSRPTLCHRVSSIYLAAPLDAQAWTPVQTRLSSRLHPHLVGPLYGDAEEAFIASVAHLSDHNPLALVNPADTVLLPEGLKAWKRVARLTGLELDGASLTRDGGFDAKANRQASFNAGLLPNIKENPRNRKTPKRGRKRLFNAAIHALRMRVERTFAWEDKFKRV